MAQRFGSFVPLKPEMVGRYRELHESVWPEVAAMIRACHIENYSIYIHQTPDGRPVLFSYFEYTGNDLESDAARMAADETTRKWWAECVPCLDVPADTPYGKWWQPMEELWHLE
jgi:L-rhamnose mutarotase